MIYASKIRKIKFNTASDETNLKDSYANIVSYDIFRNGIPYPGGVYDGHLGTTEHLYNCLTCYNGKSMRGGQDVCLGHDGHLSLNYPVFQPLTINEVRKWIKLICFNCGKPIINSSLYKHFPRKKRLDEASKLARTNIKTCIHCDTIHPLVTRDKQSQLILYADVYNEEKKLVTRYKLYPHIIREIFDKITDETVIELGKEPSSHPRQFILKIIKVPAVTIRPDVKRIGTGRSSNDDLTTMVQYLVKKNETLPVIIPQIIQPDLDKLIYELNDAYYEFIKGTGTGNKRSIMAGTKPLNSITDRLRGKGGRFRKNEMGKRVHVIFRSTIAGDPKLPINTLGVPQSFARTIQIRETVQEFNKQRLMIYFHNGRNGKYPGCSRIIKKSTGREYTIDKIRDDFELDNGDIIFRDMIDGDPVDFNRQPSLNPSAIGCHRAVITEDPDSLILRMNVSACPWYNADFNTSESNSKRPYWLWISPIGVKRVRIHQN